jgi:hypothetical protein
MSQHQFADQRVGEVAARIHHDDVTRLRQGEGFVNHQIIARPGLHRQRGTSEHAGAVHRPQARTAGGEPRHHVTDIGGGQRAEALDHRSLHGAAPWQDPESQRHSWLPD